MTADDINKELEKMYKEYIGVFNEVSKYSDDYSYPTFIKCTDEYVNSETKVLFLEYESEVWYRDRRSDSLEQQTFYNRFAPWVYNNTNAKTAGDYMSLYEDFSSVRIKVQNDVRYEYWKAIDKIEGYFPKKQSWSTLFSYFYKSDINYRNKTGRIKTDKEQILRFVKKMEYTNNLITKRELEILNPDIILIFSSGTRFGNGKYFMEKVLGERASLKFVPESRDKDNRDCMLYINQTALKQTQMYMLPNDETCIKDELSGLRKAFKLLMDKKYLSEQMQQFSKKLWTA